MQNIKKRTLAILMIAAMMFAMFSTSALAATQAELDEVNEEKNEVAQKLIEAEEQVEAKQAEIDELQVQIDEKTAEYEETQENLENTKQKLEEQKGALEARVRAMYKTGAAGYVDIILSSDSLSDFFSNIELVKKIYTNDQQVLKDIKEQEKTLEAEEQKLAEEKAELDGQMEELEAKKAELDEIYDSVKEEYDALEAEAAAMEAEISATLNKGSVTDSSGKTVDINSGTSGNSSSSSSALAWPCTGLITCEFGQVNSYHGNGHSGMDIANSYGTPIKACAGGTVIKAGYHWSYGNYVVINHGNGLQTLYGHNSSLAVSVGQTVSQGQVIAYMGSTGYSTGNHCHLSVYLNGSLVNPRNYLS